MSKHYGLSVVEQVIKVMTADMQPNGEALHVKAMCETRISVQKVKIEPRPVWFGMRMKHALWTLTN